MNILMTGRGTSGSWKIRGEQLGRAIGATVVPQAIDVGGFDAAVVIKRAPDELLARLRRADVPIIWDVVDAWPQPSGNDWPRSMAIEWLVREVGRIRPRALVCATRQMRHDAEERLGLPCLWLPHHARPGIAQNPIRERVSVVGYEGGPHYLGRWERILRAACEARGWRFEINPASLADLDIAVALREARGYPVRSWKSNVKQANAQGSGTPIILQPDDGYTEMASGGEVWAETEPGLQRAFDLLTSAEARRRAGGEMLLSAPRIADVARSYVEWLSKLSF